MFTPYRPDLKNKANKLRKEMTAMEKKLWFEFLRLYKDYKFLRQKPIGNYIADFYCAKAKLIIEIDGDSHFLSQEAIEKDAIREKILKEKFGLRIIRFTNIEVKDSFEGVCREIEKFCKKASFAKGGGA